MNRHTLTFELSQEADELHIHFDETGLDKLISALVRLREQNRDHDHLMTPQWGGDDLSDQEQSESSRLLNKVTLHKW